LAHFFEQPLTLAYLIAGFFIGLFGMGWVKSQEPISVIARPDFHAVHDGAENYVKKIVVGPPANNWRAVVCSACSS
jgi:hypothetical protein